MSAGVLLGALAVFFVPLAAQLLPASAPVGPLRIIAALIALAAVVTLAREIVGWNRSDPGSRRPETWANVRLSALVLLLLFLVSEVGAAAVIQAGGMTGSFYQFRARQTLTSRPEKIPHPFLLLTNNPERPGVNALGFLDRDWPKEKPAGTIRIACLGASTTEDGYPRLLADELARRLPDRRIEVMNFANGAWTTAQTLINYELTVRHYSPDWIVVHHAANDLKSWGLGLTRTDYSDYYTVLSVQPHADDFWVRYYYSYAFGKYLFYRLTGRNPGVDFYQVMARKGVRGRKSRGPASAADVALFAGNLREIAEAAQAHGTRVLLTTQPYSLSNLSWSDYWVEDMRRADAAIRDLARDMDLPLVDLDSLITGHDDQFRDPVHLHEPAVAAKAHAIAGALVPLLRATPDP